MNFNIGDRVRVKDYEEIEDRFKQKSTGGDPSLWNSGKAKCCRQVGKIVDAMYSNAYDKFIYRIHFDGQETASRADFTEEALELLKEESVTYRFENDVAENVVIVVMYEDHEDGSSEEVGRGHGHIIHEGALGIAQATSYAMYRLYKRMEENNL